MTGAKRHGLCTSASGNNVVLVAETEPLAIEVSPPCTDPDQSMFTRPVHAGHRASAAPSIRRPIGDRSPIVLRDDQGGVEQHCHVLHGPSVAHHLRERCRWPFLIPDPPTPAQVAMNTQETPPVTPPVGVLVRTHARTTTR